MAQREDTPADVKSKASELANMLAGSISIVRDLFHDLMPPGIENRDIAMCLFDYCTGFSKKTGIAVEFFSAAWNTSNPKK
ncbi:MAG: hypothetical protein FP816_01730 [Desulfobacteraceae bacterium]|nr:hypothetical protein [Desulfobacteraceae bacterium]MBU4054999.1 hypothetical protein [Pseudomonadota bacterium]